MFRFCRFGAAAVAESERPAPAFRGAARRVTDRSITARRGRPSPPPSHSQPDQPTDVPSLRVPLLALRRGAARMARAPPPVRVGRRAAARSPVADAPAAAARARRRRGSYDARSGGLASEAGLLSEGAVGRKNPRPRGRVGCFCEHAHGNARRDHFASSCKGGGPPRLGGKFGSSREPLWSAFRGLLVA